MTEISSSVIPYALPNPNLDNVVTEVFIRAFTNFDPFTGVSAQVVLFNSSKRIIKTAVVKITGEDWQNWPASTEEQQDKDYIMGIVLRELQLTKSG